MTATVSTAPVRGSSWKRTLFSATTGRILFPFVIIGLWYLIYYTIDSRIFPSPRCNSRRRLPSGPLIRSLTR